MNFPHIFISLMIILAGLVLVAGCDNKYPVQESELVIVKLSSDGSVIWTQTIDRETANYGTDIIQTSDDGYLIPGSIVFERCTYVQKCKAHPRVIKIDKNGQLLWDWIFNESESDGVQSFQNPDNSITFISSDGMFRTLDRDGKILKNQNSGVGIDYITRTSDGGYILINSMYVTPVLIKLNPDVTFSWNTTFAKTPVEQVTSVIEMDNDSGYLAPSFRNIPGKGSGQLFLIHFDYNGSIINETWFESIPGHYRPGFVKNPVKEDYLLWYSETLSSDGSQMYAPIRTIIHLDKTGNSVNRSNQSLPDTLSPLEDGGLIAAGYITSSENSYADIWFGSRIKDNFVIMKRNPDGTGYWKKEWQKTIPGIVINYPVRIIQTSDGGYIILGRRSNT